MQSCGATHLRREVHVGHSSVMTNWLNKLLPGVGDRYLASHLSVSICACACAELIIDNSNGSACHLLRFITKYLAFPDNC